MLKLQIDPGGEKFLQFAKRKLAEMKRDMLGLGQLSFSKFISVSTGARIMLRSVRMPDVADFDFIRISSGGARWDFSRYPTGAGAATGAFFGVLGEDITGVRPQILMNPVPLLALEGGRPAPRAWLRQNSAPFPITPDRVIDSQRIVTNMPSFPSPLVSPSITRNNREMWGLDQSGFDFRIGNERLVNALETLPSAGAGGSSFGSTFHPILNNAIAHIVRGGANGQINWFFDGETGAKLSEKTGLFGVGEGIDQTSQTLRDVHWGSFRMDIINPLGPITEVTIIVGSALGGELLRSVRPQTTFMVDGVNALVSNQVSSMYLAHEGFDTSGSFPNEINTWHWGIYIITDALDDQGNVVGHTAVRTGGFSQVVSTAGFTSILAEAASRDRLACMFEASGTAGAPGFERYWVTSTGGKYAIDIPDSFSIGIGYSTANMPWFLANEGSTGSLMFINPDNQSVTHSGILDIMGLGFNIHGRTASHVYLIAGPDPNLEDVSTTEIIGSDGTRFGLHDVIPTWVTEFRGDLPFLTGSKISVVETSDKVYFLISGRGIDPDLDPPAQVDVVYHVGVATGQPVEVKRYDVTGLQSGVSAGARSEFYTRQQLNEWV